MHCKEGNEVHAPCQRQEACRLVIEENGSCIGGEGTGERGQKVRKGKEGKGEREQGK